MLKWKGSSFFDSQCTNRMLVVFLRQTIICLISCSASETINKRASAYSRRSSLLFERIKHRLGLRGECLQYVVRRVHSHRRVILLRHEHLHSSTAGRLPLLLAPHLLHRRWARWRQAGYTGRRFYSHQSSTHPHQSMHLSQTVLHYLKTLRPYKFLIHSYKLPVIGLIM